MVFFIAPLITTLALCTIVMAHLALLSPPQFSTPWNPKAGGNIDYQNRDPLQADGSNYPCMNGHKGMTDASSAVTWEAGSNQMMALEGSATHSGGSCQVSLSYDRGRIFTVIHSYIGGCPVLGQPLSFRIPSDAPRGLAIFSWSVSQGKAEEPKLLQALDFTDSITQWINNSGNREFYHKCAAVTIKGVGGGKVALPFSKRPNMFIANLSMTSCRAIHGIDVAYPNPGPDITGKTSGPSGLTGSCGNVVATSGSSTKNSTVQDDGNRAEDLLPVSLNSLSTSVDGTCGPSVGLSCIPGGCCSQWGFCGFLDAHCRDGCQPGYGQCSSGGGGKHRGHSGASIPPSLLRLIWKFFLAGMPAQVRRQGEL